MRACCTHTDTDLYGHIGFTDTCTQFLASFWTIPFLALALLTNWQNFNIFQYVLVNCRPSHNSMFVKSFDSMLERTKILNESQSHVWQPQNVMCHLAILHTWAPFSMGDPGGTPPHTWRVIGGTENGLLVREQVGRMGGEDAQISQGHWVPKKKKKVWVFEFSSFPLKNRTNKISFWTY